MDDRKLTEQESLDLIATMISRTKSRYFGNGSIFLVWGYTTIAVTLAVWTILYLTHNPAWNWLWFLIWIIGGIFTPIIDRKERRERGVKTVTDRMISRLWSIVGFSAILATAFCLGFTLMAGIDCWSMMFIFALIILSVTEIAQGIFVSESSLIWGGGIGLTAGIFTACCIAGHVPLEVEWYMPLFGLSFGAMMLLPGYAINYKARKNERA